MQRLVAGLEHDALLWVHRGRFRWRDAEALVVEELEVPQEGPVAGAFQNHLVVKDCRVDGPSIRRDLRDNVAAAGCERAEPSGSGLAARKSAAQSERIDHVLKIDRRFGRQGGIRRRGHTTLCWSGGLLEVSGELSRG